MSLASKLWLPILIVSILLVILASLFIEINNVSRTPVWAWIVGGIGVLLLVVAVILYIVSLGADTCVLTVEEPQEEEKPKKKKGDKLVKKTKLVSADGEIKSEKVTVKQVKPCKTQCDRVFVRDS